MHTLAGMTPTSSLHGHWEQGLVSADSFKTLFKVLLNRPHRTLIFCHSSMSGGLVLTIDPQRAFLVHQRGTEGEPPMERQEPCF